MPISPGPEGFLPGVRPRRWEQSEAPSDLKPEGLYLAECSTEVEVVFASARARPQTVDLRSLWSARWGRRPSAVLLVAGYETPTGSRAAVAGLRDKERIADWPLDDVRRTVTQALLEPTPSLVEERLLTLLQEHDPDMVLGLENQGLFATHELHVNVPSRPDWETAQQSVRSLRHHREADILSTLGWTLTRDGSEYLLGSDGRHQAVAVVLQVNEVFDRPSSRFGHSSPVEQALAVAHHHRLRWVVAVQGTRVRLYTADPDTGIARKGTATYAQLDLALLADERWGYVSLLLAPSALSDGGSVDQILVQSAEHATSLGARLRERVYNDIVPRLAETVARRTGATSESDLTGAYHQTLVVLFRLLFVAYAEDRGLLPYRINQQYQRVALKTRAKQFAADSRQGTSIVFDPHAVDIWQDLQAIWSGIYAGHRDWGIPAYGGSLFAPDDAIGSAIAGLSLTNLEIGTVLLALLVDTGSEGNQGPVDFQTVSVREFGTIYEGLLESSLSIAPTDLALDKKNVFVPAGTQDEVVVRAGAVYFHNASGVRKATGSYFTKPFAVEHLLSTALDPSVDEHLERIAGLLETGDNASAAAALFDFRVADLAMGSGHFLVAAIDHIASRMSAFLTTHPIAAITAQLELLRGSAHDAMFAAGVVITPTIDQMGLIRRQVARRCIYGVDINRIAVDLARLAVWIHTFIPGLPMSTLDHGLIVGNSLTGIGTLDEAIDVLEPDTPKGQQSLLRPLIEEGMAAGAAPLRRVGLLAEATVKESQEVSALIAEAMANAEPTRLVLDAAVAGRLGVVDLPNLTLLGWEALVAAGKRPEVQAVASELCCLHFPVAFPEVFLRDRPGFDVVLGNPPWDELQVEELKFWNREIGGLKGKPQAWQQREMATLRELRPILYSRYIRECDQVNKLRPILMAGPFPGIGKGDIDLYQLFTWRGWQLLRDQGRSGIVLPRTALQSAGLAPWRTTVLEQGEFVHVSVLTNGAKWVFDDIDARYSVCLTTVSKLPGSWVCFNGPFYSAREFLESGRQITRIPAAEFASWGEGAPFPVLPTARSLGVFSKLRSFPRLDQQGNIRAVREFDATTDRRFFDAGDNAPGRIPVYTGRTFDVWSNDSGEYYAWANPNVAAAALQARRLNQRRIKSSAFYGLDDEWIEDRSTLPMFHARLAFRDIARATDTRTLRVTLLPPNVVVTNKAPWIFVHPHDSANEAYLLGLLSSIPMDWYSRRYIELSFNFHIFNSLPIPGFQISSPLCVRVVEISGRLAATDVRYAEWAAETGVVVGSVADLTTKNALIAELDALVGHLYGLVRSDVEHIFETFHRGWDFRPRLNAVLAHFDRIQSQQATS